MESVLDQIDAECSALCKKSAPSIFHTIPASQLHEFQWQTCIDQLQSLAPTILKILQVITSHSDSRNKYKCGESHNPAICMAVAVLLKERNQQMCGVQEILSLLYSSRLVCRYR